MALGATYSRIVSLMLRQALIPAVLGLVAGILSALAASRLLTAFLFGVQATDPATFSATIGLFFCAVHRYARLQLVEPVLHEDHLGGVEADCGSSTGHQKSRAITSLKRRG